MIQAVDAHACGEPGLMQAILARASPSFSD